MFDDASRPPFCSRHPGRRARAVCVRCDGYVCEECLREGEGGVLCPGCAGGPAAEAEGGSGTASGSGASREASRESGRTAPRAGRRTETPAAARGACSYHPDEHASALCSHCGAPICYDCRKDLAGKPLCPDCYAFMAGAGVRRGTAAPVRPAVRAPGSVSASAVVQWKLWPGLAFLPLPFLLEFLITWMVNQGGRASLGASVFLLSTILYASLLAFAAWQVGAQPGGLERLGITGRNLKAGLSWGVPAGLATYGLTALSLFLSVHVLENWGWIENWLQGLREISINADVSRADLLVTFLVVVLVGPVCEEVFFRGYLYPPMRRELGMAAGIALNAGLFALVHFSLFGLVSRAAAGCIFCYLYERTDTLAAPVAAHMINNLAAFLLPIVRM